MTVIDPFMRKRFSRLTFGRTFIDICKFVGLVIILSLLIVRGASKTGYHWQWYRLPPYILSIEEGHMIVGPLLKGVLVTLQISGISLLLAVAFGLTAALFRLSSSVLARVIARAYVGFIRNTPLLVQLFFVYFVLAPVLDMGRLFSAVLALSLFEGAYVAEIFRAGILSVPRGQWEGAYSLGMGSIQTYRHVVLPQAIRYVLPPLVSQAVSLIKDSALVSTIAIYDLTMEGQAIIAETYLTFEVWFAVAFIYLLMTVSLSSCVTLINRNMQIQP